MDATDVFDDDKVLNIICEVGCEKITDSILKLAKLTYLGGKIKGRQALWRSVDESLPEELKDVLVAYSLPDPGGPPRFAIANCCIEDGEINWFSKDDDFYFCNGEVTHWLEIPELPKNNKK